MVILYIVVVDEWSLLAARPGYIMKGGLCMVCTVSIHENEPRSYMMQEQKAKKQHRPRIFSSMLMSCHSDELLLQNDLPLREKPENQNEVRYFLEQSAYQDQWQTIPSGNKPL